MKRRRKNPVVEVIPGETVWKIVQLEDKAEVHCFPADERDRHELTARCICNPKIIPEKNGSVILHKSFDGRENFEPDHDCRAN